MEFFNSVIQTLAAVAVGVMTWFVLSLGSVNLEITAPKPASVTQEASTTAQVASSTQPVATSTATTTTKVVQPKKKATPLPPTAATSTTTTSPTPIEITNDMIAQTNSLARGSLVNILCTFRTTKSASYISGSGIVIDSRGIIITNAHVAQYYLLQNYPQPGSTSCTIRTGSPATDTYKATLLYLPPLWVDTNSSQILSDQAVGTGERDYAFLLITGPTQFAPALPSSFAAVPYSTEYPKQNDPVLLAGYPAGFLGGSDIQRNLYVSASVSKIGQLYTFNSAYHVDLVSLGGTVVAQSGSSGGAAINLVNNKIVGLIATESSGETTAQRDLRAITFAHINESLQADNKGGIAELLSGNLLSAANTFNSAVAPDLTKKLIQAIEKATN